MRKSIAGLTFLVSTATLPLKACPCGCSSSATESNNGPLQLQAGETWRLQSGLSRESLGERVNGLGELRESVGPQTREVVRFGLARSVSDKLSVSSQFVVKRNSHSEAGSDIALGDPSIAARYSVYDPHNYNLSWPSIAVYVSYKHAVAKSAFEPSDAPYELDVHGAGASELAPGVDCEFRQGPWGLTIGESLHFRRPALIAHQEQQIGWGDRTNLSASYSFWGQGQILASFLREAKRLDAIDGKVEENSDALKHGFGLSGNMRVGQRKTLSLGLLQTGALFSAKNIQKSVTVDVGYTQAI